jgi:hypothetical protein
MGRRIRPFSVRREQKIPNQIPVFVAVQDSAHLLFLLPPDQSVRLATFFLASATLPSIRSVNSAAHAERPHLLPLRSVLEIEVCLKQRSSLPRAMWQDVRELFVLKMCRKME